MDRLERRLGFLAVPGLGRMVVAVQALCFVGALLDPRVYGLLVLDPARVAQGQLWRLVTFLFLPSLSPLDVLFAVFYFLFQWMVFQGLESEWGAFKLTLYCGLGWLCALALPLLAYALFGVEWPASGGYWSVSVELAFAFLYPDFTIYVYLILPVKMKWMAWLAAAFLLWRVLTQGWPEALAVGVGLLNYLVFFGPELVRAGARGARTRRDRLRFDESVRRARAERGPRACSRCGAGSEAFLRLCCCARCGGEGRLWCDRDLPAHLAEAKADTAAEAGNGSGPGPDGPRTAEPPVRKKRGATARAKEGRTDGTGGAGRVKRTARAKRTDQKPDSRT